jgi:tetratricopeptide (TPR) repeat protein
LWLAAGAIVVLTLVVFLPVRQFQFVSWDDPFYVTENAHVLAGLTWNGLRWALTAGAEFYWHPLTWLSHMCDVQLYGTQAGGHHVTNLLIHLATSLLLLITLFKMTGAPGRSAFVAALFAVHPLHVEAVAWVAERKELLSGFFWVLTLAAYTAYVRRPGWGRWAVVLASFLLGLASKPMIVTLPIVLLLVDVWPLRRVGRTTILPLLREKLALFALAALGSAAAIAYQQQAGAVRTLDRFPLPVRLGNAVLSYATYLRQTIWPTGLAGFYPYPTVLSPFAVVVSALLLVGVSALVWRSRRQAYLVVGWLWFPVTLLPVIGIVQVGEQAMADRFVYIPIVGLLIIVAWGVPELLSAVGASRRGGQGPREVGLFTLAAILVLAAAVAARAQVEYWRDSEALWRRAEAVTRDNHRAHANLGILYASQGRDEEAIAELTGAVRIVPNAGDLYNRIGTLHLKRGSVDKAREAFATAMQVWPEYPDARNNLGTALEREGRVAEAIDQYREAVRLKPDYAIARDNLATALATRGQVDDAIVEEREAIRVAPRFVQARNNLGLILAGAGRMEEAIAEYLEALRVAPDYATARANLGDAYAMVGKWGEAAQAYRDALRLDPRRAPWHFKLAMTLQRLGDIDDAAEHLHAALEIDPGFEPARRALREK